MPIPSCRRSSPGPRLRAVVVAAVIGCAALPDARADEPVLPVLLEATEAVYPPEALAEGRGGTVLLELDVDETGAVMDARVAESSGDPAFDDAALAAVRDFRFEPARDGLGRPTAARIGYRYVFEPERAPVVSLTGRLLQAGIRQPLAGLDLRLVGPDGETRTARTDADGAFELADLAVGLWRVALDARGWEAEVAEAEVEEGQVAEVTLYAVAPRPWEVEDVDAEIEVVARARPPEVTERTLGADEIRILPGSNGDVVKAIQNLPGIARPPLGIGQLIIRGTNPEDSRYTLDGMEIPLVFHFAGLSTVVNGDLLDQVTFLPGDFSARYGRNLGGRVDIRPTRTMPERTNGYVSVDLFQVSGFVEAKVSEKTAIWASVRRSYADAVLTPVLSNTDRSFRAPRYWDATFRVLHRLPVGTVDALVLFSDDRFAALDADEDVDEGIGLTTTFLKARVSWLTSLGDRWRNELAVLFGPDAQTFRLSEDEDAYERRFAIDLRDEVTYRLEDGEDGVGWRMGVDVQTGPTDFRYAVTGFGPEEEGVSTLIAPAFYMEPTIRRGRTTVVPGIRADLLAYAGQRARFAVDPRVAVRFQATDSTLLKAATGKFTQFPTVRQSLDPAANPDVPLADGVGSLRPGWSLQSSIGVEQGLPLGFSVEATAYYNRLFGLVQGREDRFRFFTGPPPTGPLDSAPYASEGTGMICGAEVLVKLQRRTTTAWLSGTFGQSFRTQRGDEERSLFAYDQPVVVNALFSQELPKRWRIGARARLSLGTPYTPVVNRFLDLDDRSFIPVFGDANSARLPPFWSFDVRVDKEWVFDKWALTLYLDVQNVTNNRNVEVIGWTEDYAEEDGVLGLPIVPVFGLKGAW